MGFFDFLFASRKPTNVEVAPERIWMTTDAKFSGIAREVAERSKSETVADQTHVLPVPEFSHIIDAETEYYTTAPQQG